MLKAKPTRTPAHTSGCSFPLRIDSRVHQAADTVSSTSTGSGLLSRVMATVIGVSASTSPATVAAACPKTRRTAL